MTAMGIFKILNDEKSRYSFRYTNILEVPRVKTEKYGKNSLRYTSTKMWNGLQKLITAAST